MTKSRECINKELFKLPSKLNYQAIVHCGMKEIAVRDALKYNYSIFSFKVGSQLKTL